MKLHLPRLLSAALLAAFVSAPVYSATIPDGYEPVYLDTPSDLVGGTIGAETAYVLFDLSYSVNRSESTATTPFFTGSSILFTPESEASTATITFAGGKSQAFYKVQDLTFERIHRLSLNNMTSGAIYMEGNPDGERPDLTISGIDDGNPTRTDVDFYKNSSSGNCGGAIQMVYSTVTMNNNGEVRFFENSATAAPVNNENQNQGSTSGGGASVAQNYTISLFGINLSFDFGFGVGFSYEHDDPTTSEVESMDICGGAINLLSSSLSLTENQHVYFTTNKAVDFGGAISASPGADSIVTISGNDKVTFRKNEATGVVVNKSSVTGGGGGAIFIGDHGSFVMSKNGDIVFEENLAATAGGAIYIGSQESGVNKNNLFFSENEGNISFAKNVAGAAGGAIFMESNGRLEMTGNTGVISFEQNRAGVSGGAISAQNARVTLNDNNQVVFRDNLVFHQKTSSHSSFPKPYYVGGAIHGSDIQIHGNNSVLFERNAEMDADGYFRLRSLYVNVGTSSSEGHEISLSAGTGQSIEFRDSIYVEVGLFLNSEYDEKVQDGDIIFTGVSTAEDLAKVKENWNKIVKENNLDQYVDTTVTTTEIENSRTSIVLANTNLQAGRLRVEKGAIFKGNHLLINNESILRIDDAKVVNIDQNGNIYNGSYVQIGTGATLEILGHSTIEGGTLKFSDGSNWNVHLTGDNVGNSKAALKLTDCWMDIKGKLTLTLNLSGSNFTESFCLLNGADASYANISEKWNKDNIKVVGTGDAAGATFDDLYWSNGALYYESTLVWTNGEDTGLWTENDDKNWLNDRAFHYGANTKFTDVGEGGTVTLVGKIASAKVTVDNSAAADYTFTGQDEEAGFLPGTDIVKRGEGSLTLDVATGKDANNDYAGSVSLEGGTLNLHDDNALGGSVLKTAEGTTLGVGDASHVVLDAAGHDIKGDVEVAEGSSLKIASGSYAASSSNVDGELIFDGSAAMEAGTLAGSGNLVVKNGAAVEFKDASGFTGNVSVTGSSLFLTIADGILRAGEIAVNAGDLTLRASEQLTMAGGTVLSMVAGTVAEKVTTVVADKVIELAGNAMFAAMMNSMLGDLDKDGILNEDAAAEVVGAGITLNAGSTLKLENCHIRLEGDNSCLTLNVTTTDAKKINLVLLPDDILTEDSVVQLFSGADKVNFVYDGTIISGNGHYECDANHYFTGSMVGADTKLVYSNGNVYMKGLVPEPTTATLSLLALAALATRRRRR